MASIMTLEPNFHVLGTAIIVSAKDLTLQDICKVGHSNLPTASKTSLQKSLEQLFADGVSFDKTGAMRMHALGMRMHALGINHSTTPLRT